MSNLNTTAPSVITRLCVVLGLIFWVMSVFCAWVEVEMLIPQFFQFNAKLPAPTQFVVWAHWGLGAICAVVVFAVLVKEYLRFKWAMVWDVLLLILGFLVCVLMHLSLWLPMLIPPPQSLMGGGQH